MFHGEHCMSQQNELTTDQLKAEIQTLKNRIEQVTESNAKLKEMIDQLEDENHWLNIAVGEMLEEVQVLTGDVQ